MAAVNEKRRLFPGGKQFASGNVNFENKKAKRRGRVFFMKWGVPGQR